MLGTGVVIRLNGMVKKSLKEKVIVKGREYVLWISGEEHSRQREDRAKALRCGLEPSESQEGQ